MPKLRVSVTIAKQSDSDRRDTMLRVAINGFGRIGRNVLRAVYESGKRDRIQVVAVNELAKPDAMAHLLQYDTSHGRFGKKSAMISSISMFTIKMVSMTQSAFCIFRKFLSYLGVI